MNEMNRSSRVFIHRKGGGITLKLAVGAPGVISPRGQTTKSARFYSSEYEENNNHIL
jgi:hypothetical protein